MSHTYKYPRPAVTVDCVVFGLDDRDLQVVLIQRDIPPFEGEWALPGGFVHMDETLEEAALRELREETGIEKVFLDFKKMDTMNRKSYDILVENPGVAKIFIKRRRLIQLTMGSEDSVNLLSPSMFKCHVRGCEKNVALKSFNNMSTVRNHLISHTHGNGDQIDESCCIMIRRLKYLEDSTFLRDNAERSNHDMLVSLL